MATGAVEGADHASGIPAARFGALWREWVATPPSPPGGAVFADLHALLEAPGRAFHNLGHVLDCLRHFDDAAMLMQDPAAVEIALWFHDAIYAPGSPENERRSAELFVACSEGAPMLLRLRVCRLIMATRHTGRVQGNDRRLMVDIDLAGFGAPWEDFMRHGEALRTEFAAQSDADYYAGQIVFLRCLAQRKQFYATEFFRDRYEAVAQDNVRRLLALRMRQGYAVS